MSTNPGDTTFARAVLDRRLVTEDELREAQDRLAALGKNVSERTLGEVLVELGFLTRTQLARLNGSNEDSGSNPAQQIPGYQLIKKCGAGAMAVVYKAKQLSLDRTVAIKVLPRRLSKNQEFVERFYREGKAAAALNHNNIVQAIDVASAGEYHYFVMEFVEGNTVYDEIAEGKLYREDEAILIVRQVAEALRHAHERGIIHRDVKPKNIMLTRERVAKLADMGLARAASDRELAMAEAGRAYGTPYYISPEQIRGEVSIDLRADIYSLGATLYHMVTGRVPFEGPTPSAVMHKHLKEALTPPDHINTSLTTGIAVVIEKMMAKNRDERYPSSEELLRDFDHLSRGEPPAYAESRFDENVFDELGQGEEQHIERAETYVTHTGAPVALTVMLGILLAASIVVNIVLAAT